MAKVLLTPSFDRAYKRRIRPGSSRDTRLRSKIILFIEDPFDNSLKTHKLGGRLDGYWSFTVEYDLRVIFYFEDSENAVFVDIGTHKEVY